MIISSYYLDSKRFTLFSFIWHLFKIFFSFSVYNSKDNYLQYELTIMNSTHQFATDDLPGVDKVSQRFSLHENEILIVKS